MDHYVSQLSWNNLKIIKRNHCEIQMIFKPYNTRFLSETTLAWEFNNSNPTENSTRELPDRCYNDGMDVTNFEEFI